MVRVCSGKLFYMKRHTGVTDKAEKKFLCKLGIKVSDLLRRDLKPVGKVRPARNIGGSHNKRLVHRKNHTAVADYSPHIAERLSEGVA